MSSQSDEQAIREGVAELEVRLALQRRAGRELLAGLREAGKALGRYGHKDEAREAATAALRALAILEEA